jgi:F-type H+-transporting ATPase subunit gamma
MGSLKEIRVRIASVQSTQKITGAMKMVSAAKLRKAQNAIISLRPYSNKLNEILQRVSDNTIASDELSLFEERPIEHVLLVVITSNRGLCGSFNVNVTKEVLRVIEEKYPQQAAKGNVQIICIGKKGKEQLSKKYQILQCHEELIDAPTFSKSSEIAAYLMNEFLNKKLDKVEIIYNRFINPATQTLVTESFLPVTQTTHNSKNNTNSDYIFEPSKVTILEELIPKILKLQFHKTIIDSIASEHGARMTAMHKATDNATEILRALKLKYNNARQTAITTELIEIVSGAEALNG